MATYFRKDKHRLRFFVSDPRDKEVLEVSVTHSFGVPELALFIDDGAEDGPDACTVGLNIDRRDVRRLVAVLNDFLVEGDIKRLRKGKDRRGGGRPHANSE